MKLLSIAWCRRRIFLLASILGSQTHLPFLQQAKQDSVKCQKLFLFELAEHNLQFTSENVLILFQAALPSSRLLPSTMSFPKPNFQDPLRPTSLRAPHKKRALELQLLSVNLKVPLL